jgi:hypothetical protein
MKEDVIATLKFMYKRGMLSKHHYTYWLEAANKCEDPEVAHLWWDSITAGVMFEGEGATEAKLEAMEELIEDEIEQKRMCKRSNKVHGKMK